MIRFRWHRPNWFDGNALPDVEVADQAALLALPECVPWSADPTFAGWSLSPHGPYQLLMGDFVRAGVRESWVRGYVLAGADELTLPAWVAPAPGALR